MAKETEMTEDQMERCIERDMVRVGLLSRELNERSVSCRSITLPSVLPSWVFLG